MSKGGNRCVGAGVDQIFIGDRTGVGPGLLCRIQSGFVAFLLQSFEAVPPLQLSGGDGSMAVGGGGAVSQMAFHPKGAQKKLSLAKKTSFIS